MIKRLLEFKIKESLKVFRGIYIYGPRQSGKTTFVQYLSNKLNISYISLDDKNVFGAATSFPDMFFKQFPPPIVIDEIQLAPELIPYIKQFLDKTKSKGQIILTGSADFRKSKEIRESLVGRVVGYPFYTFSATEISERKPFLLNMLFTGNLDFSYKNITVKEMIEKLCIGGFPEIVLNRMSAPFRKQWFAEYINSRIVKDLQSLESIRSKEKLISLVNRLAWQTGGLLNLSQLAADNLSRITVEKYVGLLEALFLIEKIRPFWSNVGKRFVKMPKIFFTDTGLLCYLLNANSDILIQNKDLLGQVFENYIFTELKKELSYDLNNYDLYFFRDNKKNEVDFVLQNQNGEMIALEVKAKTNLHDDDFKGLKFFTKNFPKTKYLYLLYMGNNYMKKQVGDRQVIILPAKVFFNIKSI